MPVLNTCPVTAGELWGGKVHVPHVIFTSYNTLVAHASLPLFSDRFFTLLLLPPSSFLFISFTLPFPLSFIYITAQTNQTILANVNLPSKRPSP